MELKKEIAEVQDSRSTVETSQDTSKSPPSPKRLNVDILTLSDIKAYTIFYRGNGKRLGRVEDTWFPGEGKYSRIIMKKYKNEWLQAYEKGGYRDVHCVRSERGILTFLNDKPERKKIDKTLLEKVNKFTYFYSTDGKLKQRSKSGWLERIIVSTRRYRDKWNEIHGDDSSYVYCLIHLIEAVPIPILYLGRSKDEIFNDEEYHSLKRYASKYGY